MTHPTRVRRLRLARARMVAAMGAVLTAALLLTACGGRPAARPRPTRPSPSPSAAARARQAPPARLAWRVGETFTGAVNFDEEDRGGVDDELRFTARERFQVTRLESGVATVRVVVTWWRWQRNTSELLTTSLPQPFTFRVDAGGEILSGVDWPLPSPDLPLPGLDLFAAPITPGRGWSRTDGEGAALSYRGKVGSPPGTTALDWSLVRPRFTTAGEPITVSGGAEATVSSRYQHRGRTVILRSTREQASFERTARSAAGATQETGTILETTVFSSP